MRNNFSLQELSKQDGFSLMLYLNTYLLLCEPLFFYDPPAEISRQTTMIAGDYIKQE